MHRSITLVNFQQYFSSDIITKDKDLKVCAVEVEIEASKLTQNSYKVI
jgi:hypothetical protein